MTSADRPLLALASAADDTNNTKGNERAFSRVALRRLLDGARRAKNSIRPKRQRALIDWHGLVRKKMLNESIQRSRNRARWEKLPRSTKMSQRARRADCTKLACCMGDCLGHHRGISWSLLFFS
jgi:hypothetical protein